MKQVNKIKLISNKSKFQLNKKSLTGWLTLAILFLIFALFAGILGFGSISGASFTIAKWLAIIFLFLFIITVIAHTIKRA